MSDILGQNTDISGPKETFLDKNTDFFGQHQNKYCCNICGIRTDHKTHYETHLLTNKHKKNFKHFANFDKEFNISHYECSCGKYYNKKKGGKTRKRALCSKSLFTKKRLAKI